MFGKQKQRLTDRYSARVKPVDKARQLEALNVPDGEPVTGACLAILRGLELIALEMTTAVTLGTGERDFRAGQLQALGEAQEAILAQIDEARQAASRKKEKESGRKRPEVLG